MSLTDKERVRDISDLIDALRSSIKYIQTNLDNPQYVERAVLDNRKAIDKLERDTARLLDDQQHGAERIDHMRDRINELSQEKKLIVHKHKIEQLLKFSQLANRTEPVELDLGGIDLSQDEDKSELEKETGDV